MQDGTGAGTQNVRRINGGRHANRISLPGVAAGSSRSFTAHNVAMDTADPADSVTLPPPVLFPRFGGFQTVERPSGSVRTQAGHGSLLALAISVSLLPINGDYRP
jgi:hypothetical protein